MTAFLNILILATMLATLFFLGLGLATLLTRGKFSKQYSQSAMQGRLMMQGLALLLLFLLFYLRRP